MTTVLLISSWTNLIILQIKIFHTHILPTIHIFARQPIEQEK
jgi:hypothetical protein